MKKMLVLVAILLVSQLVLFGSGYLLSQPLMHPPDCSGAGDSISQWECNDNSGATTGSTTVFVGFALAAIALPPVIAKYIFGKLHRKLSWKRAIITQVVVLVLVVGAFVAWANIVDPLPKCGCGG